MAKNQKNIEPEYDSDDEASFALEVCEGLALAAHVAKKLFGEETPTPDTVFGVYDRLAADGEGEDEQAEDLLKAQELAKELFSAPIPTPSMVFGVFDRVFLSSDEEDDE